MSEPTVIELMVPLPDEIANFGLSERVTLPPGILERIAGASDLDAFADLVGEALQRQLQRVGWSIATSLTEVLRMRARTGAPLEHEAYIAEQTHRLQERQARLDAATAALQAEQSTLTLGEPLEGVPDAPKA